MMHIGWQASSPSCLPRDRQHTQAGCSCVANALQSPSTDPAGEAKSHVSLPGGVALGRGTASWRAFLDPTPPLPSASDQLTAPKPLPAAANGKQSPDAVVIEERLTDGAERPAEAAAPEWLCAALDVSNAAARERVASALNILRSMLDAAAGTRRKPKVAKGMRDFLPDQARYLRDCNRLQISYLSIALIVHSCMSS